MSVLDRLKKIVIEQLGVDEDQVTPDASITDDLGADSLDRVELVMAIEQEFDIGNDISLSAAAEGESHDASK